MEKIKSYIKDNKDVALLVTIMLLKLLYFNFSMGILDIVPIRAIAGSLGSILIITSLICLRNEKGRRSSLLTFNTIITIMLITDTVYNRYFHDITSVALIKQIGLVGEVRDSVTALFKFSDLIYVVDFIYLVPKNKKYKKAGIYKEFDLKTRAKGFAVIMIMGVALTFGSLFALQKDQPGIMKTIYDKKYVVSKIGNLNFHVVDAYNFVANNILNIERISDEEKEEVKEWYDNKNQSIGPKYTNKMEGKNLIIVQLEAFQGFVLGRSINGQEITPNLNKLANQSLVFDNYYYQTAWGGTSDAEFLSNISLLPARDGAVYYIYPGNTYDSMIEELKGKGYFTSVMHANRPGFWNRAVMYKNIGFDTYESEEQFEIDEVQCLGLSDKSFFRQAVQKMENYNKPFYSFLITLSSHFPFKDSQNKINDILDVGEFEGELMGDYLKSVKYTDEAIGEFVEALKEKGLWDNSVVIFYGDHSAIPQNKKDQLARLLYGRDDMTEFEWFNAQKVVMMAHFPNEEIKGTSSITAGQMDLYPTIANLFGFDAKYSLGRDLLNSDDGFVVTRAGMWANNEVAYIKPIDKVLDLKTGQEKNPEEYKAMFEKAERYLKNSDAIIEHDLICYFNQNNQYKDQEKN